MSIKRREFLAGLVGGTLAGMPLGWHANDWFEDDLTQARIRFDGRDLQDAFLSFPNAEYLVHDGVHFYLKTLPGVDRYAALAVAMKTRVMKRIYGYGGPYDWQQTVGTQIGRIKVNGRRLSKTNMQEIERRVLERINSKKDFHRAILKDR